MHNVLDTIAVLFVVTFNVHFNSQYMDVILTKSILPSYYNFMHGQDKQINNFLFFCFIK